MRAASESTCQRSGARRRCSRSASQCDSMPGGAAGLQGRAYRVDVPHQPALGRALPPRRGRYSIGRQPVGRERAAHTTLQLASAKSLRGDTNTRLGGGPLHIVSCGLQRPQRMHVHVICIARVDNARRWRRTRGPPRRTTGLGESMCGVMRRREKYAG